MNKREIGYWIVTVLFCLAMAAGAAMNLFRVEAQKEALASLGYPEYLMTILGVAKALGVIALLIPRFPLLKEWAYAGFTFDLLGASASHAFSGHSVVEIAIPLVLLALVSVSCCLRPGARRLVLATASDVPSESPG